MNITRGLHNAAANGRCVLTIGNFDGVHRGHQVLLARLRELAREQGAPPVLLTFEPHPVEVLAPERAPPRLTDFRHKMHLLAGQGLERVVCARFHRGLAAMTPEEFITRVLCERLRVQHLLVGDDFRFGRGGAGDYQTLRAAANAGRFALSRLATVSGAGERISSSRIRQCLRSGDLEGAAALLGRPFAVCGRVARGQRLGHQIGFPTANFRLRRGSAPLAGVFAVALDDGAGTRHPGVANVGRRPTVGGTEERVEVHVLDFSGDLYGQEFQVVFLQRLRGEQRFAGLAELKAQIARDVDAARAVHAARGAAPVPGERDA